jgi:hypothetical protein
MGVDAVMDCLVRERADKGGRPLSGRVRVGRPLRVSARLHVARVRCAPQETLVVSGVPGLPGRFRRRRR